MKRIFLLFVTMNFILFHNSLRGQIWQDCNEVIITVDDFNTDLDFSNQSADCGCNNAGGECTLVRIRMVETINGIETPVSYSSISFTNPITAPLEPNYSFRDYIDIYNPYFSCREYQSQGTQNHNYNFSPVAPAGHEFHLLVCPGSEQGQMRGRFFSLSPGTPLAAPTNVQASDGANGIEVTFDAIPGKYYMAYRSTENCNQSWTPIDPSMPWPQATSNSMTIPAQSFIPDQQFEYRVVASDNGFVVASGTDGAWSEGDLGHYGTLTEPYDITNDCVINTIEDCGLDIQFSSDDCENLLVEYLPNYQPDKLGVGLISDLPNCESTSALYSSELTNSDPVILTFPFSDSGPNDYVFFMTGTTNDGTVCPASYEHSYRIKPDGVIIPTYVFPFSADNNTGTTVDFDPPIIMDCPQISGYESTHVSGDFFPCGCNEVVNTIYYSDGSTVNYSQFIEVSCSSDCDNDTTSPICIASDITISGDPLTIVDPVAIGNQSSDDCSQVNMELSDSTFTCNELGDNIVTLYVTDAAENQSSCTAVVTVECPNGPMEPDTCIVEPTFSNLLWSSYLGSDGEEEIVDIYVDVSTGIQYMIGKTNSSNFYSTNLEIGTASNGFKTFVMAINPDATLLWSTLINSWEDPQAIDMDPDGHLTLVGITDNPTLPGPAGLPGYDKDHNGGKDILILKMDNVGQNIVYSSYYGGNGDDSFYTDISFGQLSYNEKLKVDFYESKIYVLGRTNSTNLPSINQVDNNPGSAFACVFDINASTNSLEFATYFKNGQGGLTTLNEGKFAIIVNNADGEYNNFVSQDAIESDYEGFAPLPILFVFNSGFSIEYASYIGVFKADYPSTTCTFGDGVSNGTPGSTNLFDYQLDSDGCGNLYWYSKGGGFRQPIFSTEFLLPARQYRPSLDQLDDPCSFQASNPLLKINLIDEASPFIEYMLFFGYSGISTAASSFTVDANGRPHFHTRNESFFTDPDFDIPTGGDFGSDLYFVFENDLSDVEIKLNAPNTGVLVGNKVLPVGIDVYDNKAYLYGGISDLLSSVTTSWTDEDGNTNTIPQDDFGLGLYDGFITVIDNNELCACDENLDTEDCKNVALHFDGIDDKVVVESPLSGNSDYTISLDFNWAGNTQDQYARLIGFDGFQTEIGVRPSGEMAYYTGTWINTGVSIKAGECNNFILRRQGTQYDYFLNGQLLGTQSGGSNLNFTGQMHIGGRQQNSSETWSGLIDNVRVFSTPITNADITNNFSSITGTNYTFFNFEEGTPSGSNANLTGPIDVNGNVQATFSGFALTGTNSNYLCDDCEIVFADPCEFDNTPPLLSCPIDIGYIFSLENELYTPSVSDFDISAIDDCKLSYDFDPLVFDCDDLGSDNQVTITVTDEAGNASSCDINFTLLDLNDDCFQDTCTNNVMNFDGIDDKIVADSPLLGNSDYTISVDFSCGAQTNGTYPRILGFSGFETEIAVRGTDLAYYNGTTWRTNQGLNVADNIWHNVTLVRANARNELYLDGILISSLAAPASLNFVQSMQIGGNSSGTDEYFQGSIDNVKIWNLALSQKDICENINTGLNPNVLFYDFEEGLANANNTNLVETIDLSGGDHNGVFSNMNLIGDSSNYVCDNFGIDCIDPCTDDQESPTVSCSTDIIEVELNSNGLAPITIDLFDIEATDNCSVVSVEVNSYNADCDDIGLNLFLNATATDQAGLTSICQVGFITTDPNNYCDPCIDDQVNPICQAQNINIELDQFGQGSISPQMIDNNSSDDCSEVTLTIDVANFDCNDVVQNNVVVLTASDLAGNTSSCTSIVTVEDKLNACGPCCQDEDVFLAMLVDGYQISRMNCEVIISFPNELTGCTETTIDFGNSVTHTQQGAQHYSYTYPADGEYEVCIETVQRNLQGEICNSSSYCTELCVTCTQECEEDMLVSTWTDYTPFHAPWGLVNDPSCVFLDGDHTYAAHSIELGNGNYRISIMKDFGEVYSIVADDYIQVAELQMFGGELYLAGSFRSDSIVISSPTGNVNHDIVLYNHCYDNGVCLLDGFVVKFNEVFTPIWAFSFGDYWRDVVNDMSIIGVDEFAITGYTRLSVDFDPNDGSDFETLTSADNGYKAYIASYSPSSIGSLPKCDWVNTFRTDLGVYSYVDGLGINHDAEGNIYAVGEIGAQSTAVDVSTIYNQGSDMPIDLSLLPDGTGITVPQYKYHGYVAKFSHDDGQLLWFDQLSDSNTNVTLNDVAIDGDEVFVVGRHVYAKYHKDQPGLIAASLEQNFDDQIDLSAIEISGDDLYVTGSGNNDAILAIYDKDFNIQKSLTPGGGNGVNEGTSISVAGDKIAICGSTTTDYFNPDYPNISMASSYEVQSNRDFFVALYECECNTFEEPEEGSCCNSLSSVIKEATNDDYCCGLSISNEQGVAVSAIGITFLGSNGQFDSGQLALSSEFSISNISTDYLEVTHSSGFIPQGVTSNLIDFCIFDENNSAGNQQYVISYIEKFDDQRFVSCQDTLSGNCDTAVQLDCLELSNITSVCFTDNAHEISFELVNTSPETIDELVLSDLPNGFEWQLCDVSPPVLVSNFSVDNLGLLPGETVQLCISIYSSRPISEVQELSFTSYFVGLDGKEYCSNKEQVSLAPCCESCDEGVVSFNETKPCCFSVSIDNLCEGEVYDQISISTRGEANIVNVNFPDFYSTKTPYELCKQDKDFLCLTPIEGVIDSRPQENIVSFCIDQNSDLQTELEITLTSDLEKDCVLMETISCPVNSCKTTGFSDPKATAIGNEYQMFSLECDAPPYFLDCPDIDNIWINGQFNCSSNCIGNINVDVFKDGLLIEKLEAKDKFGTWEVFLNKFLIDSGLYQIEVTGGCDGEITMCTYQFEIGEDCFKCICKDLVSDLELGLEVYQIDKCERGFIPNGAKDCDMVSWSVDGINSGTTVGANAFDFRFEGGSGEYTICYEILRDDGVEMCEEEKCIEYTLDCDGDDLPVYDCQDGNNENGDFSSGAKGAIHDNEDAAIQNWELKSGEVWFYEKGGSVDSLSGYAELLTTDSESSIISTRLSNSNIIQSDKNMITVSYDVRSNTSHRYAVYLISDTDTLSLDTSCDPCTSHENIWESKLIAGPGDDIPFEDAFLEIALIGEDNSYQNLQIDNVCIEIERTMVNTNDLINAPSIHVYPNPFKNSLSIKLGGGKGNYQCELISALGVKVLAFQLQNNIDYYEIDLIDEITSGLYYLSFYDDSGRLISIERVVKL